MEIRNRAEHSLTARLDAGYDPGQFIVRFKQLDILSVTYNQQTIDYEYDAASRLLSAAHAGTNTLNYDRNSNLIFGFHNQKWNVLLNVRTTFPP